MYDAFDRLAAEYAPTAPTVTARTEYRTTDHLGSTRVVTDEAKTVISRRDFYPFGERIGSTETGRGGVAAYGSDPELPQRFTAKERDDESNLDYFLARYYASSLGRFNGVDPENAGARKAIPQSWNGYSYTFNRPLSLTDPDGRAVFIPLAIGAAKAIFYGAATGAVVGGGVELVRQQVKEEEFSGDKIGRAAVGGAVVGGVTGGVGGPSGSLTLAVAQNGGRNMAILATGGLAGHEVQTAMEGGEPLSDLPGIATSMGGAMLAPAIQPVAGAAQKTVAGGVAANADEMINLGVGSGSAAIAQAGQAARASAGAVGDAAGEVAGEGVSQAGQSILERVFGFIFGEEEDEN